MLNVPSDRLYTPTHEWVKIEGDLVTVGITDYAQSELGDIVYLDLPTPGRMLEKGGSFGTVESVKTVSDLYSPVAGEVVEANPALESQSELLNTDPYDRGWIVKLKSSAAPEGLLDADAYKAKISG